MKYPTPEWMEEALCRQIGDEIFFPKYADEMMQGQHVSNHLPPEAARACELCPVTQQCLDYALTHQIEYGVWGGTSATYRIRQRRAREAEQAAG